MKRTLMPMRTGRPPEAATLLLVDSDVTAGRTVLVTLANCFAVEPELIEARNARQASERLRSGSFDIVLIDLASLGELSGATEAGLERLVKLAAGALVIVLSDGGSVSAAMAAMRVGAHDVIAKPVNKTGFSNRIRELAERHGKRAALTLSQRPRPMGATFSGLIGTSSQMQVVYEQIERIAPSSAPIFITGETGTEKALCAEALHARGPRAEKRFVTVNCKDIPRDRLEDKLFGVMSGAYTGHVGNRKGAVELADGGTLFLDEIGEMDLSLQSRLLRFLQTGAIARLGEPSSRPLDIRVICATSHSPMQLISERKFREELFYRLHVLPIHLPPLRQRPGDTLALAHHFLAQYCREEGKVFSGFSNAAANLLAGRDWPGNVSQLQNYVRRLVVRSQGGEIGCEEIEAADMSSGAGASGKGSSAPVVLASKTEVLPMWRQEQAIIEAAISSLGGNIALAAAALEISPSTIYRKRQAWAEMEISRGAA